MCNLWLLLLLTLLAAVQPEKIREELQRCDVGAELFEMQTEFEKKLQMFD